jgi:hypothetical protein
MTAPFFTFLPGVVALPESRSTPGYYHPPFQGFQFVASQTVGSILRMVRKLHGKIEFSRMNLPEGRIFEK